MSELIELKDIFSKDKELKIGETTVLIKIVTLGDISDLAGIVSKVMEISEKFKKEKDHMKMILNFISTDFDSVIKLLTITTDLKEEVIKKLSPAAGAVILSEVFKENSSFFVQYVLPAVKVAAANLKEKGGQAQSKN